MDNAAEKKYRGALDRDRPRHEPYDDFSIRHPRMPLGQRAKIFSPFAALAGFEEAIDAKLERYVEKRELNEEEQAALERALAELCGRTRNRRLARSAPVTASVTYYVPCPDEQHEAYGLRGSYETVRGRVWGVDAVRSRTLRIDDTVIAIEDIAAIRIEETAGEDE